jgi:acyl-CoA synthetase (NDP forming)
MAIEQLRAFFEPRSVAPVGANDREGTVARTVLENLLLAKSERRVFPVNPNREKLFDLKCYPSLSALPETPELARNRFWKTNLSSPGA